MNLKTIQKRRRIKDSAYRIQDVHRAVKRNLESLNNLFQLKFSIGEPVDFQVDEEITPDLGYLAIFTRIPNSAFGSFAKLFPENMLLTLYEQDLYNGEGVITLPMDLVGPWGADIPLEYAVTFDIGKETWNIVNI